jgi:hypothetical protein
LYQHFLRTYNVLTARKKVTDFVTTQNQQLAIKLQHELDALVSVFVCFMLKHGYHSLPEITEALHLPILQQKITTINGCNLKLRVCFPVIAEQTALASAAVYAERLVADKATQAELARRQAQKKQQELASRHAACLRFNLLANLGISAASCRNKVVAEFNQTSHLSRTASV